MQLSQTIKLKKKIELIIQQEQEFIIATWLHFLASKADGQYLLKTFRKKIRLGETLNNGLKQYRQQDCKIAIRSHIQRKNKIVFT